MKVCLIQMNSRDNKQENLRQAEALLRSGIEATEPDLVMLPELFTYVGGTVAGARASAEELPGGPGYSLLSETAKEYGVYLHGGSLNERLGDHYYNTTLIFGRDGGEIARYRKIHLFDVTTPDGKSYRESATYSRGGEIVSCNVAEVTLGLSICYDLRFSELYARLADKRVDMIAIPAAFTLMTGKDHWEVLCRARAIETQAYVLAANQTGPYMEEGIERASFGGSMIIDPWGTVIARAREGVGYVSATLDFDYLQSVRTNLPVHQHHVLDR